MIRETKAAGLGPAAASRNDHIPHSTTPTATDKGGLLAETAPMQLPLFGLVVRADDRTTTSPCPRCGATVAVVGAGAGPHHAELRCLRGHFLRWLPKPVGAQ